MVQTNTTKPFKIRRNGKLDIWATYKSHVIPTLFDTARKVPVVASQFTELAKTTEYFTNYGALLDRYNSTSVQ